MAAREAVAIMKFDDRNRYGQHGIPATVLFGGGKRWIVNCKRPTKHNQWAKVRLPADDDAQYADLVDILGDVGDHAVELLAMQLHFRVKPCRYPPRASWGLTDATAAAAGRVDAREQVVFSVDNASTRDIDDALSLSDPEDGRRILGIHVADVAARIPAGSELYEWARLRASSAYNSGVFTTDPDADYATQGGSSVPMLPPELAHDELSLNEGVDRFAVTLWVALDCSGDKPTVAHEWHERTVIRNGDATTYAKMGLAAPASPLGACRDVLRALSGDEDPEDLIAWTMIRYNAYFGRLIASQKAWPGGNLRAQQEPLTAATYVRGDGDAAALGHASLGLDFYAHCSSPIRRFADLVNQYALFRPDTFAFTTWGDADLAALNDRVVEIKRYHASVDAMELAYGCRGAPRVYKGRVEADDERGLCLLVETEKRRARVPLHDSYFAEPIVDAVRAAADGDRTWDVELCGVLIGSRTRLRARLVGDGVAKPEPGWTGSKAAPLDTTPRLAEALPPAPALPEAAAAYLRAAEVAAEDEREAAEEELKDPSRILQVDEVNAVIGYPIDDFQQRSLAVITDPDLDLLAMAPTGSGKTAVALIAILQAFARGQRAVYTSPIKALSNQKFSEFTQWFRGRGIDAHVTLLTGDVKIRAPPGSEKELIICTSEILRNKLVKASGADNGVPGAGGAVHFSAAQAAAAAGDDEARKALETLIREGHTNDRDPDLERLGCVVSDEIHYINDVDRGAVWEETLMHLPKHIQLVALSATLKDPQNFLHWIESARKRSGKLVRRLDRHVPLHVGGLCPKTGALLEFYGTHDSPARKGGVFDDQVFHKLLSKDALEKRNEKSAAAAEKSAAHRAERDAERQAQRDAFSGGRGGASAAAPKKGGRGGGGKGGGKGGKGGGAPINFTHECLKLARALDAADKLPGIVFCMSRKLCCQGAHACKSLNLLLGTKGPRKPDETEGAEALAAWEAEDEKRQGRARDAEAKRKQMHRKYLERYMPELGELEAYRDINGLLEKGVAYHHSGMLPILREYVELCFQQKLVKLVFATETLAVGVNMPARTVAFSQLDKPDDTGSKQGHRWLRVDEFWQMAGRAGRRGLDVVGYVVYAPTLSVAGLRNLCPVHEMNRMLTADVCAATSQLVVDRPFVLRHLARGHDVSVLGKTLKADEARRANDLLSKKMGAADGEQDAHAAAFERFKAVEAKLDPAKTGAIGVSLKQKDLKKLQREKRELQDNFPGGATAFLDAFHAYGARDRQAAEIEANKTALAGDWHSAAEWLEYAAFVDANGELTPRGRCAAAFADGEPLIVGTCIADGALKALTLQEVCAWICLFIPDRSGNAEDPLPGDSAKPSPNLLATCAYADELALQLDQDPPPRRLMGMMLDWAATKDIHRVARCVDPHLLGSFVKSVMRVLSYVDVVREVLLGLGEYETHNALDHHTDALVCGLVTNESLYLRIEE